MPHFSIIMFGVAGALMMVSFVPLLVAATGPTNDSIVLSAKHFSLSIDPATCNATMAWRGGIQRFMARGVGTPTPFLSLYNKVADNHVQNMEACTGVTLLGISGPARLRALVPPMATGVSTSQSPCRTPRQCSHLWRMT